MQIRFFFSVMLYELKMDAMSRVMFTVALIPPEEKIIISFLGSIACLFRYAFHGLNCCFNQLKVVMNINGLPDTELGLFLENVPTENICPPLLGILLCHAAFKYTPMSGLIRSACSACKKSAKELMGNGEASSGKKSKNCSRERRWANSKKKNSEGLDTQANFYVSAGLW